MICSLKVVQIFLETMSLINSSFRLNLCFDKLQPFTNCIISIHIPNRHTVIVSSSQQVSARVLSLLRAYSKDNLCTNTLIK